jgi:hypothetical protein
MGGDNTSIVKKTPRLRGVSGLLYQTGTLVSGTWLAGTCSALW